MFQPISPDSYARPSEIVLTLDTDWAPGFVIEDVMTELDQHDVSATCFMTHEVDCAIPSKVEVGLHPNFLSNSTQGENKKAVLKGLKSVVPDAVSVRTHCLYWDSRLGSLFYDYGLKYDVSLCLPFHPFLGPTRIGKLMRILYWWSDNIHMENDMPFDSGALVEKARSPGYKVLNFHFSHIWLNCQSIEDWETARDSLGPSLSETRYEDWKKHRKTRPGIGTLFSDLLLYLSETASPTHTIREIMEEFG
jgi:hypothetical protein